MRCSYEGETEGKERGLESRGGQTKVTKAWKVGVERHNRGNIVEGGTSYVRMRQQKQ